MSTNKLNTILSASLKSGVAMLPLAIAFAQMPASAQPKTQAQLEAEAAAAKAAAQTGADADDAAAAAQLFGGLTGSSKSSENTKDIVVTGTNIRGVAPTGANLTVVTADDIEATGQPSINQLLTTIPGFSNFNTVPNPTGASAQGTTQGMGRPNLRGTPDGDLAGAGLGDPGSATLILIDGNRQSGAGIRSTATDPDRISPGLLERVEINTDGGSASYGSDALGGVVNFVTKKRYNGVEVTGRLGYADNYWQYDVNALAGKDWGSGSLYVSGNYSYNTPLYQRDRDYLTRLGIADGRERDLNCDLPNISIASQAAQTTAGGVFIPAIPVHYYRVDALGNVVRSGTSAPVGGIATGVPATGVPTDASQPNLCTLADRSVIIDKRERYGVSLNLFQKITDDIDILARANYAYFSGYGVQNPLSVNLNVSPNNPWRQELVGTTGTQATYPTAQPGFPVPQNDVVRNGVGVTQTVMTNLSQVYGDKDIYSSTWNRAYGGNVEATWRVDGNWQVKATAVWDRSITYQNYGFGLFGGFSFLLPYQEGVSGTAGLPCQQATDAFVTAGGNAAANDPNSPQRTAALAARAAARQVCINPYNPEGSDPTILFNAHNVDSKSRYQDTIQDYKINVDGALFTIPGGKVRVAVGGEYQIEDFLRYGYSNGTPVPFSARDDGYVLGPTIPNPVPGGAARVTDPRFRPTGFDPGLFIDGSKWIWSVYAEANIPLISRANELTWVKEFRISLQGRYDKFQKYGSSFNPRIGVNFKPTSWLGLRGNWSTSFRTPSATANSALNTISIAPAVGSAVPISTTNPVINPDQVIWSYNQGARDNLVPTTGMSWSVGIDLTPFRGFRATISYQHIDYTDRLASPNPLGLFSVRGNIAALTNLGLTGIPGQGCTEGSLTVVLDEQTVGGAPRPSQVCSTPSQGSTNILTQAQIAAAKAAFVEGALNAAEALADPRPVYALADGRYNNVGNNKLGTLDYSASYNSRTPWGSVNFSVKGTVALISKTQSSTPGAAFTPDGPFSLTNPRSKHSLTATAGMSYGPLRSSITVTHSDGYDVTRSATAPQDHVGSFSQTNFFASWDFKGDNVVERGLQLVLTVNNLLNARPPVRYTSGEVRRANGSTIGRLIQVGFTKKF